MNRFQRYLARGSVGLVALVSSMNFLPDKETDYVEPTVKETQVQEVDLEDYVSSTSIDVDADVERLNKMGYDFDARDLLFLQRVAYFEGTYNGKGRYSLEEAADNYRAVIWSIVNRHDFIKETGNQFMLRKAPDEDNMYVKIARAKAQYSCTETRNSKKYFRTASSYEKDEAGNYQIAYKGMKSNKEYAELAYRTLIGVLDGSLSDNTEGSTHYKNPKKSSSYWDHGDQAFWGYNFEYTKWVGNHKFYKLVEQE